MVTLLCLIYGEPPDRAFPVCIRMSSTVADLKNKIRLVHPALGGTITLQLTLWRVSIPPNRVVNQLPPRKLHRQELPRRKRIYHIFTKRPVAGHIHIMIEPPKSLFLVLPQLFKIIVKPQNVQCRWAVYVRGATLSGLKHLIQAKNSTIEITDETTITYTTTDGVKRFITDNSELQHLLIITRPTRQSRPYRRITINLETPQKPFTDYTFPMVCRLFGLSTACDPDFGIFPPFEYGTAPDYLTNSNVHALISELQLRKQTTGLSSLNETTSSSFVFSFLVVAASLFQFRIIIKPQKQLQGRYGRGPVDFAFESTPSGGFIGVTIVTGEDFTRGIAQNIVQLESFLSNHKRELTETTDTPAPPNRAFGLVTDASVWYILECVMDSTERISVKMAEIVQVIEYKQHDWMMMVEDVYSHLVWLLLQILLKEDAEWMLSKQ